jgi:hypothetical protein
LYYYRQGIGFNGCAQNDGALLTQENASGQCGSFALLLQAVFAVNGISSDIVEISRKDKYQFPFLVKAWEEIATTNPPPGGAEYRWRLKFNPTEDAMVPPQPNDIYGDLRNTSELRGQNSAPPSEKLFGLHYIVKTTVDSDAFYYDPSYGVKYFGDTPESAADYFETNAVQWYADFFQSVDTIGFLRLRSAAGQHNIKFSK